MLRTRLAKLMEARGRDLAEASGGSTGVLIRCGPSALPVYKVDREVLSLLTELRAHEKQAATRARLGRGARRVHRCVDPVRFPGPDGLWACVTARSRRRSCVGHEGSPDERRGHGGEQKANSAILRRVKQCRVSFRDSEGIEHAVDLEARTLYEAVGLAIERFRRCEHVTYDPKGRHEFVVESREPGTQHRLTRNMFDAWLRRPGGSPADVALKTRLKGLLGEVT